MRRLWDLALLLVVEIYGHISPSMSKLIQTNLFFSCVYVHACVVLSPLVKTSTRGPPRNCVRREQLKLIEKLGTKARTFVIRHAHPAREEWEVE